MDIQGLTGAILLGVVGIIILWQVVLKPRSEKPSPGGGSGGDDPATCKTAADVYPPMVWGVRHFDGKLTIDMRYQEIGCQSSTGLPELIAGAKNLDPSKPLIFTCEVEGAAKPGSSKKVPYTVFDRRGVPIVGDWIPETRIGARQPEAVAYCFIGWTAPKPPYPMAATTTMGCGPTNPPPVPEPERLGELTVRYTVRNAGCPAIVAETTLDITGGGTC